MAASEREGEKEFHHQPRRYIKNNPKLKRSASSLRVDDASEPYGLTSTDFRHIEPLRPSYLPRSSIMGIKLYSVSDSPPTLAVRMALKYLNIEHEVINIDYAAGEHFSPEYIKVTSFLVSSFSASSDILCNNRL